MVKKLDEKAFGEQVLNEAGREVVAFYSASDPNAMQIAADMDKAAADVAGNADVFWVDIDEEPALAHTYADGDITYVLFEDGKRTLDAHKRLTADQLIRMATDLEFGAD